MKKIRNDRESNGIARELDPEVSSNQQKRVPVQQLAETEHGRNGELQSDGEDGPAEYQEPQRKKKRLRKREERMRMAKMKHSLLERQCKCKTGKCKSGMIPDDERAAIHESFWNLDRNEQRIWMACHVTEVPARRKVENSKRKFSRIFKLPKQESEDVVVCQKFFLSTLGYTSSTVVDFLLKACKDAHGNPLSLPRPDQRGRHEPTHKISPTPIKLHINSFSPKPSHYRRSHAPNRKYLPPDLSIKIMHKDFCDKYPENKVSYEKYRRTLDEMNISFYEYRADKCSFCIQMDMDPTAENIDLKQTHLDKVT